MRIIYYICAILAAGLVICCFYANILKKEINALTSENRQLKADVQGYKQELKRQQEVNENVEEREKSMEKTDEQDKGYFDWDADISNSASINELRKQCKSCSNSAD